MDGLTCEPVFVGFALRIVRGLVLSLGQRRILAPWPLGRIGVDCVAQCIVGVVLEPNSTGGIPLGVLLAEPLFGETPQIEFLSFAQLHNQNVVSLAVLIHSRNTIQMGAACGKHSLKRNECFFGK